MARTLSATGTKTDRGLDPSCAAATTVPSTRRTCPTIILTNYFTVRDGTIVSLIIIRTPGRLTRLDVWTKLLAPCSCRACRT